jgi:hypothetical protein
MCMLQKMEANELSMQNIRQRQGKRNRNHRLFSALNLSHASFSVPNTALEIMRCSVVAVVEI